MVFPREVKIMQLVDHYYPPMGSVRGFFCCAHMKIVTVLINPIRINRNFVGYRCNQICTSFEWTVLCAL